jgi:hypothetical protein
LGDDCFVYWDLSAARAAVVLEPGELVSARVTAAAPEEGVEIDGEWWRLAKPDEQIDLLAPVRAR